MRESGGAALPTDLVLDALVVESEQSDLVNRLLLLENRRRRRELSGVGVLVVVRRENARDGLVEEGRKPVSA